MTQLYVHVYVYMCFFKSLAIMAYYKLLNIASCATHQVLVGYLFYTQQCVYVNLNS